jgi:NAD+ synthetase
MKGVCAMMNKRNTVFVRVLALFLSLMMCDAFLCACQTDRASESTNGAGTISGIDGMPKWKSAYLDFLEGVDEDINPIADGNIQARLRMIYLYNLASVYRGLVMDTDNLTENNLGYFTIHGDVGDFNPIGGLWKTEVFKLAEWLFNEYKNNDYTYLTKAEAMWASLQLKPTAGLGITDSDLDEIGADSYDQVDYILQEILAWKKFKLNQGFYAFSHEMTCDDFLEDQQMLDTPYPIIEAIAKRHFSSEFKRKQLPIKIPRHEIVL